MDRVNLIPYGKEEYGGTSYDKLDWIPFKFFDVVGKFDMSGHLFVIL